MAVTLEAERRQGGYGGRDGRFEGVERIDESEATSVPSVAIDLVFEEAFDDLYTRAYGVAFQLLGRRSEAEDVAQETLARAFVRWRKIRSYAEAWVVRVAGNLAVDVWRRLRRVDTNAATERRGATAPGPNEQRIDLHRALDKLSGRQRDVLILRFLADLPEADVAKALGCSVGSVKQHASRGLATLRTTMASDDAGDTQEH